MNTEAHLALGWILAHCGGPETRRFRRLVVFASLAPDLDVVSYLGGSDAYARLHHALGHNLFFSLLVTAGCMTMFRHKPWKILLFTQLAFYSHYFGDYFFTRFPLEFFWPISNRGYIYGYRIGLDHWINTVFSYGSFVLFAAMAVRWKRTPIELVWPKLDQRVVNLFRKRTMTCHVCGRGASEVCSGCLRPVCLRHGRITARCDVICTSCADGVVSSADRGEAEPTRGQQS